MGTDSFKSRATLAVGARNIDIYRLDAVASAKVGDVETLPFSLKVLLENLLRFEDGVSVKRADIEALASWDPKATPSYEIAMRPARVLLQDFTGVPAVVDLAAMREAFAKLGGDPTRINPLEPADLVIDHSVQVDSYGMLRSFEDNVKREFERNLERYQFLKWGQQAFDNMRVVPPGTGIVHQVNIEYLARVVFAKDEGGKTVAYPDSLVGTDSHTTMVNALGVLGWGVGGIEAEAAMLGQPITMLIPQVIGFKMTGKLPEGATATDLVLTVTEMLRKKGVVEKFVEFYGDGLDSLSLPDRATIANMAPEYGATMGFFPVDAETIAYLKFSGRDAAQCDLVEKVLKAQGMFRTKGAPDPRFTDTLSLDLGQVVPSLAGPKRPQDRVPLVDMKRSFGTSLKAFVGDKGDAKACAKGISHFGETFDLPHGAVVIAAITSCTNTSNPAVMIGAGLLARNAVAHGLKTKPWVKTSLSPGSQVVTEYLKAAGLMPALESLRFHLAGYGCMTCIGNSGPLDEIIAEAVKANDLVVAAVLSGNRNFEGRINPSVKANYLASPPLVVAYALAGRVDFDFATQAIGKGVDGKDVYLKDIWPSQQDITTAIRNAVKTEQFVSRYAHVQEGPEEWRAVVAPSGSTFAWDDASTYIRNPPFFDALAGGAQAQADIVGARALALLGDSVTTDHISPAGNIAKGSPAARYLEEHGVSQRDFNSYGARRGNHEVMMRGTFANIRLKNLLVPGTEGGVTKHLPEGTTMSIYDAAMQYKDEGIPLVILAGKEYGTGSSRDWAAKGTLLLGVKAVIAESFERIHRSNLVGMGVLPLEYLPGHTAASIGLTGDEVFSIRGIAGGLAPRKRLTVEAGSKTFEVVARIDTPVEIEYLANGGILPFVLRQMMTR